MFQIVVCQVFYTQFKSVQINHKITSELELKKSEFKSLAKKTLESKVLTAYYKICQFTSKINRFSDKFITRFAISKRLTFKFNCVRDTRSQE